MSELHLSEVTIGEVVRWINQQHLNAARENPQNRDYMRSMQECIREIESIMEIYTKYHE